MRLPDRLTALWRQVEQGEITPAEFQTEQERLLATYRDVWQRALCSEPSRDLTEGLLDELGAWTQRRSSTAVEMPWRR